MDVKRLGAPLAGLRTMLEIVSLVMIIAVGAAMLRIMLSTSPVVATRQPSAASRPGEPRPPVEPLSLAGAKVLGSRTAKVGIEEYSDFQCPYCAAFARDTLPSLIQKYVDAGKVLIAFRYFPLESIHPRALRAAEAAECASQRGQFWKMHDQIFGNRTDLTDEALRTQAVSAGVDGSSFDKCLADAPADRVKADASTGSALGITGTPTFFIGTIQADGRLLAKRRLSGALPLTQFVALVDELLGVPPAGHKSTQ